MMDMVSKAIIYSVLTIVALFALYVPFVYAPVLMYAEAECLKEGYPEARVSVGLERYCMNLDGSITVRVDKQ